MSEQLKESLSAVMDGEADEFEIRRVLNEAATDPELRGVWERYHLVRSVMRGEGRTTTRMESLTSRLWAQIDRENAGGADDATGVAVESSNSNESRSRIGAWGQRIAGVAVAAGVAAAVIFGFRTPQDSTIPAEVAVVEPATPAATATVFGDDARDGSAAVPAALDVQRAHAYMLHHAHHVALNNRSVVPFVKVAAFESK